MATSILVPPETEQEYLTITGKVSLALALFVLFQVALAVIGNTDSVIHWALEVASLASAIYCVALGIKSTKFAKNISRLGFWTLTFDDEYVDYVSSFSLSITCHILIFGTLILAFWGDSRWFVEVIAPFEITNALQVLLGVAAAAHGTSILWKLREEELDE
ncbi:hypothetical protein ACE414_04195 [Alteromonas macleodii]|uniref:hypothetical protein n=1 Tax=Alteromonas macleodii TaxID=28108 RepID=UPI003649B856